MLRPASSQRSLVLTRAENYRDVGQFEPLRL